MNPYHESVHALIGDRTGKVFRNPTRANLIDNAVRNWMAIRLASGTLVTWTARDSTGRSPKDTYIVKRPESEDSVDWSSPSCIPMDPDTFDMLFTDTLLTLSHKDWLYAMDRVVGADTSYALPILTVMQNPLAGLFVDNMFRPVPQDISSSRFADKPFILLVSQFGKLDPERYLGRLRTLPDGSTSTMAVAMDFDRRIGIVHGSSYMGTIKKLAFTVMNYYLPAEGILPLHCSANEGPDGDVALFLGLSGTGKTTLSTDPSRSLLGDDEHGWSDSGVANFENGCYAKLYNLDPAKEPEVYNAVFHPDHYLSHGSLVENLMVYPDGSFDFDDDRFTQNSRAAYPLSYLKHIKERSTGGHPKSILFLTADAYGVLPPVARLTPEQAMFWFMMGYTSKLAGTETGVVDPEAVFSRFFGAPFMARKPQDYADLLRAKLKKYGSSVYLVNTGWSGGGYGTGTRIDITTTRAIVHAALSGDLEQVAYDTDPIFKLQVPQSCPGVSTDILWPVNTWADSNAYMESARKLTEKFRAHFEKAFSGRVAADLEDLCPAPVDVKNAAAAR